MSFTSRPLSESVGHFTEKIISQDPSVHGAVMFGRGRFNAGVLVEPVAELHFDPTDKNALETYREKIWYAMNW